jgi:hypothetical protein
MLMLVTGYAAAKIVNAVLTEAGLPAIPPQMVYNYTTARLRAGKAPLIACDAEGRIDTEALEAWVTKYVAKKVANATK